MTPQPKSRLIKLIDRYSIGQTAPRAEYKLIVAFIRYENSVDI